MPGLIVTYFLEKSWHLEFLKISDAGGRASGQGGQPAR
jgi:hypothetical protein